jgi:hypothetical protein
LDKKVYALNPDGTKKWEYTADTPINTQPYMGPDGTLYTGTSGSDAGELYALGLASAPVTSAITIQTSASSSRLGRQFILSGVITPSPDLIGKIIHVDVKKPNKSYWSYSSNRRVYAGADGAASWQYKYTLASGNVRGTYYFKAVFEGGAGYRASSSRNMAVSVR